MDSRHALRVLRRDRGDDAAKVHAKAIGCSLICGQTRTAAAVGTGNRPDDGLNHDKALENAPRPTIGIAKNPVLARTACLLCVRSDLSLEDLVELKGHCKS